MGMMLEMKLSKTKEKSSGKPANRKDTMKSRELGWKTMQTRKADTLKRQYKDGLYFYYDN